MTPVFLALVIGVEKQALELEAFPHAFAMALKKFCKAKNLLDRLLIY